MLHIPGGRHYYCSWCSGPYPGSWGWNSKGDSPCSYIHPMLRLYFLLLSSSHFVYGGSRGINAEECGRKNSKRPRQSQWLFFLPIGKLRPREEQGGLPGLSLRAQPQPQEGLRIFPVTSLAAFSTAASGAACQQFTKCDSVLALMIQPETVASAGLSPPAPGLSDGPRERELGFYRLPGPSWPSASTRLGDR